MDNVCRERIVAIIRLVIPCIVSIAAIYGVNVDADAAIQVCLYGVSAVAWIVAWWKDNNVTKAAIELHNQTEKTEE